MKRVRMSARREVSMEYWVSEKESTLTSTSISIGRE
jgi:hypothetical protein